MPQEHEELKKKLHEFMFDTSIDDIDEERIWQWIESNILSKQEEKAVTFAEWLLKNATQSSQTNYEWYYKCQHHSTGELYAIFNSQPKTK